MVQDEPIGSSIWSIDISSSGDRVVVGSGYPEMSIALLHGKGHKEFEVSAGGVPGILKMGKARGSIIAALVARRGIGTIMNLDHRGKTAWMLNTQKKIENIEISGDGELVIVGAKDGSILCVDKNGKDAWHRSIGVYKGPLHAFFFKDKVFTITSKGHVYIFDRTGNLLWDRSLAVFVNKVAVSQSGRICLSMQNSKTLHLFDDQGKVLFAKDLGDKISTLALSSSGKFVLAGTIHGNVYMFQENGKPIFSYNLSSRVNCLAISHNEKYFTVGTNDFFAYLFNTKGDHYWTYRTGIQDSDEFYYEFPPGCAPIDKEELKENMEAPTDKEYAMLLTGLRHVIRHMDKVNIEKELDDGLIQKDRKIAEVFEEDSEFAEEVGTPVEPSRASGGNHRGSEKKGIIIRSWSSFKDLKHPLYMVLIKNFTNNPLEAVEIIPKLSSKSFRITPDFKEFDSVPPNRKLLIKFKLEPVSNFRAFEDTQIFSEINYIDNFTGRMTSINTNKILVPFTIPQLSFESHLLKDEEKLPQMESIRAELELDLGVDEACSELEEFMKMKNIAFTRKEEDGEAGYTLVGKDYRGNMLRMDLTLLEKDDGATLATNIQYQNQLSLPPLYYFLMNKLGVIVGAGGEFEELEEEETEWLEEDDDEGVDEFVEWSEEEQMENEPGPRTTPGRGVAGSDQAEAASWDAGEGISPANIKHIIEKHGVEKELHYRGFYLIDYQERSRIFDLINNNAGMLEKCILLTREYPEKIREVHIYDPELLDIRWISTMGEEGAYSPDQLKDIVKDVKENLSKNHHSLVMIDSFEYLLNNNDFNAVYSFISELKDIVAIYESILVVNLDFGSLSPTQFSQLKKEADSAWEL